MPNQLRHPTPVGLQAGDDGPLERGRQCCTTTRTSTREPEDGIEYNGLWHGGAADIPTLDEAISRRRTGCNRSTHQTLHCGVHPRIERVIGGSAQPHDLIDSSHALPAKDGKGVRLRDDEIQSRGSRKTGGAGHGEGRADGRGEKGRRSERKSEKDKACDPYLPCKHAASMRRKCGTQAPVRHR